MSGKSKDLIARALNIEPGKVPDDARLDEWELWDSFSHEQILTELEKTLSRKLSPVEIVSIECLSDIDTLLTG